MSQKTKKTWERWTQKTKQFPENKYNFSVHLTEVGDWVQTHPLTREEKDKITKAARFWAWYHDVSIKHEEVKINEDQWTVTIRLISLTRKRQDQTIYDMYKMLTSVSSDATDVNSDSE